MKEHEKLFREFLKTKNLKLTQPRRVILNTIFSYHRHFNVEGLYDVIRKEHKNVSRATIYRTMPLLVESGLIKQSLRCQSKDHYEHIHGHDDHLHFLCVKCGEILEVDSKEVDVVVEKLAEENDFELNVYNLAAKGLCSKCRQKVNADK
ncbi:MAG: transcriptional repressor [Candidatus Cloacimonetes bacterium]|nr:transcriptional repressor [Candidatus Cloacimonadota bacterium]MCF7813348.1 transcriptional repressor [Candidatus Cloacimonadota bacterium]MCF7867837.1 transcriptional repressor [Candidatus Cloacimonadota bacterium]MCF7883277.1 transcriptional repressor [Candidatus Cloacimonadota bacterium]